MLIFKLAIKNLLGQGIRTWLNVTVLAFAFIIILFYNGMMDGWNAQARRDTIAWEYGSGQMWHADYDPYDPFSFRDAHGPLPEGLDASQVAPVLVTQASVYPGGRMVSALLKGIPFDQQILELPTTQLKPEGNQIRVMIGKRMADAAKLAEGDLVTLRWRDKNGTFDATEVKITQVFDSDVPSVDAGQIWIDHGKLLQIMGYQNEATYFIAGKDFPKDTKLDGWDFKNLSFLTFDMDQIVQSKKASGTIMYGLLLTIALLAIFDTQVLSVFRRQREIGTYIALGMTRTQVMGLFTIEGGANSLLAIVVGGLVGMPFLWYLATNGIPMPDYSTNAGMAIGDKIYPIYGLTLVGGTTLLMVIAATIVSFIPARKISYMDPTAALKGKIQ